MDSVYRALALGTDCRLCTEVTRLRARSDGQVEVSYQTSGGRPDSCVFDEVVVATTAEKALGLTTALSDTLVSVAQKDFFRTQRYTRVLHVAYIMDRLSDVADLSLLAHCGPGNGRVAAVGFHGQKYPGSKLQSQRQDIVSIYIADSDKLGVCTRDRSGLAKRCWELARELYPRFPPQSSPIDASIQDAAMPVHTVGRYKQAADFHEQQSGPIVFAGDYLATATVEGALRSGAWAADVLKRQVTGTAGAGLRTVEDVAL